MSSWNAEHYLRYGDQRTRAAVDLAERVGLESVRSILDLGCGPGNSTQVLRRRWPNARVLGVDKSPEMIDTARRSFPDQEWLLADISAWRPESAADLVYANAAYQWLPNHAELMRHVIEMVNADGGALAFQIPSATFATVRRLIHEISRASEWNDQLAAARAALTMERPEFYYDALAPAARELDIWETEYHHVMDSQEAIIDWISSTGLRPFLAALDSDEQRGDFLNRLRDGVAEAYEEREDGKVLFPFRRTFVIAYR